MKVEVEKNKERKYPYIGESCGIVVLFSAQFEGVVLQAPGDKSIGVGGYSTSWDESSFRRLNGSVTLSND